MSSPSPNGAAPPVGLGTKLFYGLGSIAFGIKDNGFQTFILLFYSQLVGLPANWVGGAIFVALVVDAFMDPIVGQMSDNWRSKWGRRHPFMYIAALPVAVSYLALWNPPALSPQLMVVYLTVVAIVVRTFITFFEIPSSALAPELTDDYDERTAILGYRYMFGWLGGLGMTFLAYKYFLVPNAHYSVGQLNPEGYSRYGLVSAVVMFFVILISAAGTHGRIPYLRQPPAGPRRSLGAYAGEMLSTLKHRSFLMMLGVGLFAAMGQGLNFALSIYFATWFWELNSSQILILIAMGFAGAVVAMVLAPRLSKAFGKKPAALVTLALGVISVSAPILLRIGGFMPANHTPVLLPTLLAFSAFSSSIGISASILISSMIADVVEDSELKTGRRSEGLFFAASAFVNKTVTGAGVFISGLVLSYVHFPARAKPGHVPQEILRHLALTYIPAYAVLYAIAFLFMLGYGISRTSHHDNLRRLADAAAAAELAEEAGLPTTH
jgi:GPH family glycoside/pentoside/hexuronide:cation symporter